MRIILFLCYLLLVLHSQSNSEELVKITDIMSPASWFVDANIRYDGNNAYLFGSYSVDDEYFKKGILAKVDLEYQSVNWEQGIEQGDSTIIPWSLKILDNSNIEILSELALFRSDFSYNNQVLSVKRFNSEGVEIYSQFDTSGLKFATWAKLPVRYHNNQISAYYTPRQNWQQALSYSMHYDSEGNFLQSKLIDSSIVYSQDSCDRYLLKDFRISKDSSVYCFGDLHMSYGVSDQTAGYIIKINSKDEKVWKKTFFPNNASFIISDLIILTNGQIIIAGYQGRVGYLYWLDSESNILRQSKLETAAYGVIPIKIMQNVNGNLIIIGQAVDWDSTSDEAGDNYIAKLDEDGNVLWQKKEGIPIQETLTDIVEYEPNKYYLAGTRKSLALLYQFEDKSISVEEQNFTKDVKVLELSNCYEIENNKIYDKAELVSIRGKVLQSFTISDKFNFQVQKDSYYRSVFFLRLSGKNGSIVKKLIY